MKIVVAADTYYPHVNGASYFTQRLAEGLVREGHSVIVIMPSESFQHDEFSRNGVRIDSVSSLPLIVTKFRTSIPLLVRRKVQEVLKGFNPDIVHIQSHFAVCRATLFEAEKLGIPVLGTNHFMPDNITHYVPGPQLMTPMLNRIMWHDFVNIYNRLPLITSPTESARKLIIDKGITVPTVALSCGIDLKVFSPGNRDDSLARKYKIDTSRPTLMFVGRHDREKQIDLIIKALGMVKNPSIQFISVGKSNDHGKELKFLHRIAKQAGVQDRVIFTGFVQDDDLPHIYRLADCFIIACPAELQSIATMQALAVGLPIIAINKVALPELVHDSENGYLFSGDSVVELAGKIDMMFESAEIRMMMGKKSLEIIKHHDINYVITQFIKLYDSLK